jgi:hypothetical protein
MFRRFLYNGFFFVYLMSRGPVSVTGSLYIRFAHRLSINLLVYFQFFIFCFHLLFSTSPLLFSTLPSNLNQTKKQRGSLSKKGGHAVFKQSLFLHVLNLKVLLLPAANDRKLPFNHVFLIDHMLKIRYPFAIDVNRSVSYIFASLAF